MMDLKKEFMENVFFANAWRDTSQHVKIFLNDDEIFKNDFRKYLKIETYKIVKQYQDEQVSFENHTAIIEKFYKKVNGNNLFKGKIEFSFGRAQKLINVLLKYYWCADMLNNHQPAHMPLDRIILQALGIKNTFWTKMDADKYKECINIARSIADEEKISLSEWELRAYEKAAK